MPKKNKFRVETRHGSIELSTITLDDIMSYIAPWWRPEVDYALWERRLRDAVVKESLKRIDQVAEFYCRGQEFSSNEMRWFSVAYCLAVDGIQVIRFDWDQDLRGRPKSRLWTSDLRLMIRLQVIKDSNKDVERDADALHIYLKANPRYLDANVSKKRDQTRKSQISTLLTRLSKLKSELSSRPLTMSELEEIVTVSKSEISDMPSWSAVLTVTSSFFPNDTVDDDREQQREAAAVSLRKMFPDYYRK
ncbi:hypothetical protein [Microvirga arabica]|uniref:hypothetical protein n=1 Tax=Microvirga arabica TaxID=1128671 RepID=UPI00193ADCC1|nr:hypothetical protein [Microvirga arabica]MBM1171266.1 hypothetical protein [Microvirga arabica]